MSHVIKAEVFNRAILVLAKQSAESQRHFREAWEECMENYFCGPRWERVLREWEACGGR